MAFNHKMAKDKEIWQIIRQITQHTVEYPKKVYANVQACTASITADGEIVVLDPTGTDKLWRALNYQFILLTPEMCTRVQIILDVNHSLPEFVLTVHPVQKAVEVL